MKHLKKAVEHISRTVVSVTMKIKTIVLIKDFYCFSTLLTSIPLFQWRSSRAILSRKKVASWSSKNFSIAPMALLLFSKWRPRKGNLCLGNWKKSDRVNKGGWGRNSKPKSLLQPLQLELYERVRYPEAREYLIPPFDLITFFICFYSDAYVATKRCN